MFIIGSEANMELTLNMTEEIRTAGSVFSWHYAPYLYVTSKLSDYYMTLSLTGLEEYLRCPLSPLDYVQLQKGTVFPQLSHSTFPKFLSFFFFSVSV